MNARDEGQETRDEKRVFRENLSYGMILYDNIILGSYKDHVLWLWKGHTWYLLPDTRYQVLDIGT